MVFLGLIQPTRLSMFDFMKITIALWAALLAIMAQAVPGQNTAPAPSHSMPAAAVADREANELRFNRLNSLVEDLIAANAALQKRISELESEIGLLHERQQRAKNESARYASNEDIDKLAKAIKDLERSREADRKLILDELDRLQKLPKVAAAPKEPPKSSASSVPAKEKEMKGYEYVVQRGDSLSIIISEFNKQGVKVTLDQVLKANPKLKPDRIPVGKKIFIPDPS